MLRVCDACIPRRQEPVPQAITSEPRLCSPGLAQGSSGCGQGADEDGEAGLSFEQTPQHVTAKLKVGVQQSIKTCRKTVVTQWTPILKGE